ncbi:MAG: aminotransferase class V-fold PLP-dependent enzyme [Betaproteobacteria bacterium]|nr:aminotransferase class V-fold PLP-dependent enzyme [Betaproteobacteria bacterium]
MDEALSLSGCRALDAADRLKPLRAQFELPPGLIYLDGNSLGALPHSAADAVQHALQQEWGHGLIRSWNDAGWIHRAQAVGDAIAPLVGAGAGELVVADSTSVNLHKVLWAAIGLVQQRGLQRHVLVTDRDNFPTDRYIAQGVCDAWKWTVREAGLAPDTPVQAAPGGNPRSAAILAALSDPQVGVVMLTHVDYRSGALHDLAAINRAARAAGVLTVWDLAHSAGAVPVDLKATAAQADFAVGCGYKYLNGGPGAPAFVWVHPSHVNAVEQPLRGWLGHAAPFDFEAGYRPAQGIARYVCGTPPILSLTALQAGVSTLRAADPLGGMAALRAKSLSLTRTFMRASRAAAQAHGLELATPTRDEHRGSQVSWACGPRAPDGYAVMRALIARGVIGDFRASPRPGLPDILRFGFAPAYNTHEEAWLAAQALGGALGQVAQQGPGTSARPRVT